MKRIRIARWAALGLVTAAVWFIGRPLAHLARTAALDRYTVRPTAVGYVDDASGLNQTRVHEVWAGPASLGQEQQVVALVRRAARDGLKVSIAGARHSMGGQIIAADGIVLDMLSFNRVSLSDDGAVLHVGAGARWSEIIPYLNARGRSVAVMQSNNDFTVGGSLSVNAHGWQHNHAPIASTVRSLRLLKSDGSIVVCSRSENRELFSLVLGGYGLFGVILDAELWTVPNERYHADRYVMPSSQYAASFAEHVAHAGDVGMAYGRLRVTDEQFLEQAILTVFRRVAPSSGAGPVSATLGPARFAQLRRWVFRGSIGSAYGKRLRWSAERWLGESLGADASRNELLNEGAGLFGDSSAETTDILEEYFVPPRGLEAFLDRLRIIVPRHSVELLNVTIRNVYPDPDAFLRYAREEVFGLVMLFNLPRNAAADAKLATLTREMIDAVLDVGGTYYLPYRLYATDAQFRRAYPQASRFFELKRKYDPRELFQNTFYLTYGRSPQSPRSRQP